MQLKKDDYIINMAQVLELADELTRLECEKLGIVCEFMDMSSEMAYNDQGQEVLNKYYDIISRVLNV